jgi:branched-chain amino acid transport system substrate-binding protein
VVAFVASAIFVPNGFLQALAATKVPAVGGPGGNAWRNSPWVFPEAASIEDQIAGLIRNGVEQGKRKLGLVYCVEVSVCTEAADQVKNRAGPAGAELLYSAPTSISQTDYTAQCLNAQKAGVDQFMMGLDGASIARLARSCQAINYRPLLSTSAALFSPRQAEDPIVRQFGVATVTGDAPWMLEDTPGLQEYHRVMSRFAPQTPPDGASVIAFTSGKLLEAALAKVAAEAADGPITPALILKGLGGIKNESLGGLTARVTFAPGQQSAASSGCTFYLRLGTKGWTTPKGSTPVCQG